MIRRQTDTCIRIRYSGISDEDHLVEDSYVCFGLDCLITGPRVGTRCINICEGGVVAYCVWVHAWRETKLDGFEGSNNLEAE
jgi:hypothetical protein